MQVREVFGEEKDEWWKWADAAYSEFPVYRMTRVADIWRVWRKRGHFVTRGSQKIEISLRLEAPAPISRSQWGLIAS